MCGISGIVAKNGNDVETSLIQKMNDCIRHRGPDDEGVYQYKNIALGHRRLAIIDITRQGHQPMTYDSENFAIVYNGEIYNYRELKEELSRLGYIFNTQTDTEVILASYQCWGEKCVEKFNGMWSFAIFSKKQNLIFCSRDRFGVKPFYHFQSDNHFYFFSEVKQILALPEFHSRLNYKNAINFLKNGILNYDETTLFENVFELRGGRNLKYNLDNNNIDIYKWYDIEKIKLNYSDFEDAKVKYQKLLEKSITYRLRADVQMGVLLSGGLDSSSINSYIKHIDPSIDIHTVSCRFKDKKYDEHEYISAVLEKTGFQNYEIFPELDELFSEKEIEETIYYQEQPLTGMSHLAEKDIYKRVAQCNLKVVLDGQGADEILAGYQIHFSIFYINLFYRLKLGKIFSELWKRKKHHNIHPVSSITEVIKRLFPIQAIAFLKNIYGKPNIPLWISKTKIKPNLLENIFEYNRYYRGIFNFSKFEIKKHIPYLLHSADRNSMAYSVESRFPFMDYELVEFTLSLPDDFKIRDGKTKYILREALSKILPEKIYNRHNKKGLDTPDEEWFKSNSEYVLKELQEAIVITKGLINENIIRDYKNFLIGKKPFDFAFFRAITFAKWVKIFKVDV
ncbi:MAG: asparagine synthase (glutamine-hydrolyzing) [Cytophagaceae bacterium]|nr:asparagine synthase (glutamine-hydrolyzing) [Cytophagaceae bacterium]